MFLFAKTLIDVMYACFQATDLKTQTQQAAGDKREKMIVTSISHVYYIQSVHTSITCSTLMQC